MEEEISGGIYLANVNYHVLLIWYLNLRVMTNDFYWEIPNSLDLEELLKKHPPDFKYKIDHFYYIIDYLSRGMD